MSMPDQVRGGSKLVRLAWQWGREEAIEECARVAECWCDDILCEEIAVAIRALKDKP